MIRTIFSQIVVQDFKEWKTVPSIPWLFGEHFVHIVGEQRPEDLGVLHHEIAKPGERLRYSVVGATRENIGRHTYVRIRKRVLYEGDEIVIPESKNPRVR